MNGFPVDRYVRAARAICDLSQRELAMRAGVAHHVVASAEHNPERARVQQFAGLLEAAGLHLIVVDDEGREVQPEDVHETNRLDRGRRRFPAHLDVRPGREDWWGDGWPMFAGKTPTYTFDRSRWYRDWRRERKAREVDDQGRREPGEGGAGRAVSRLRLNPARCGCHIQGECGESEPDDAE
jgi:transcriptional regulator with XRE-family HTH domain